jgi:hypothetical protein
VMGQASVQGEGALSFSPEPWGAAPRRAWEWPRLTPDDIREQSRFRNGSGTGLEEAWRRDVSSARRAGLESRDAEWGGRRVQRAKEGCGPAKATSSWSEFRRAGSNDRDCLSRVSCTEPRFLRTPGVCLLLFIVHLHRKALVVPFNESPQS